MRQHTPEMSSKAPRLLTWGRAHLVDQPIVSAVATEWSGLRLTTMKETDGDIVVPPLERDMIILTVEGSRRHFAAFDRTEYSGEIKPGWIATAPRGMPFRSQWSNHGPLQTFHVVEFLPSLFQTHLPELAEDALVQGHLIPTCFAARPSVAGLVTLLSLESDADHRRGRLFAETAVRLLALEIISDLWTRKPGNLNVRPIADLRIRRAVDFIEAHFTEDLSIQDIAEAAHLSPSQLTVSFRKFLGESPYAYVIRRRLDRAMGLLRQTDLPIAQVALEAGFCDQAHLTRLCRGRLGKTPRQIRQG